MNSQGLRVLLIGDGSASFSGVIRRLERNGACYRFAKSYEEAHRLLEREEFELVLSVIAPKDKAMTSLMETLAGTQTSVFYGHPVEDSCWWLPALREGTRCFGAPALRPGEFTRELDQFVEESRLRSNPSRQQPSVLPIPDQTELAPLPIDRPVKARSATVG